MRMSGRSAPREAGGGFKASGTAAGRNTSFDNAYNTAIPRMVTAEDFSSSNDKTGPSDNTDSGSQNSVVEAVDKLVAVLHRVEPPQQVLPSVQLGIVPTSEVCLEGVPVKALLDTGSPISITSFEFFLKVCVQNRKSSESPEEWGKAVKL